MCAPTSMSVRGQAASASTACSWAVMPPDASAPSMCVAASPIHSTASTRAAPSSSPALPTRPRRASTAMLGRCSAMSGSAGSEDTGYSSLGVRVATAVPFADGTVLVPRATLQWQHAFGDVTPGAALAFQGTGTAFSIAGVPIARDTALVEGGFDWRFTPQMKLGAFYQGELAAHAQTHALKGTF